MSRCRAEQPCSGLAANSFVLWMVGSSRSCIHEASHDSMIEENSPDRRVLLILPCSATNWQPAGIRAPVLHG